MHSRYRRWDGTQDPLAPDVDVGDLLDQISEDLLSGYGADAALRRLARQGFAGTRGLDDIRRRLRERRRRLTRRLNLEGPLARVRERLNEVLAKEREALAWEANEDARLREAFLDGLPGDPAGAIRELRDYRFRSPEAQRMFDELLAEIQKEVLGAYFRGLTGALQGLSPEDVARMREMLAALNAMLAARQRGEPHDFQGFMDRYGDFFPEKPRTLDELLEALARRMAAASRLLASLSPEQRRELEELMRAAMEDLDLAFQMDQLSSELRALAPHLPWDRAAPGMGDEPMPLAEAVGAIEELSDLDELERAVRGDYPGASIDDVDEEKLRQALGEEPVRDLRRLRAIEKALEEAGIVNRDRGRLELTARGARLLGERALVSIFEDTRKERPGEQESRDAGAAQEPTGATRRWRFGDDGEISVQRSIFNALARGAARGDAPARGDRPRIAIDPEDFELVEAESRTRAATALLLDLSFSMPLRGHWVPAKRMALALHALIEGKYPQDHLYLIGFSDYAWRLDPKELTAPGPLERVYGTNMQHAFMLAGRLLAEHSNATRQVIMVTDGEPTAHLADTGRASGPRSVFQWPPLPETIHKTLAEAVRLARSGVTLNIFMLEESPGLAGFMERLARLTGGRVFQAAGRDLGQFVLHDYVKRRR